MATHNYGRFIGEAIESVLAQTYPHFELIIIDDASTDNTQEVIAEYDDERIVLIERSECSCSPDGVRNDGLAVAQGDLIAIVDSDDVCLPDRFEKQVGFLEAHPEIDFLGGGTTSIDERGRLIGKSACGPVYEQPHLYREDLLAGKSVLITTTWMFRRRVLESVSGFRWYPGWGDRAFSMQASRYYNMYNLQDVLVYRRRHSSSATYRDGYGSMLGKSLRKIFTAQEYLWTQKKIEKLKQAQEA